MYSEISYSVDSAYSDLMWILGHDFSGHYNRLVLISVDIISGVYCITMGVVLTGVLS